MRRQDKRLKGIGRNSDRPGMQSYNDISIAVMIPCYNEELTIEKVLSDFKDQLPQARLYVCDNRCTDSTAALASGAGATVLKENRPGKGFAVATLMREIEADIYIMIDGDDTYPVDHVHDLIQPVLMGRADMSVGSRLDSSHCNSFRPMHRFGNRLVAGSINVIFDSNLSDIMSGFRVFNHHFVKSIPLLSRGFEIETQMSIQALYYQFQVAEVPIPMRERPEMSFSKLHTVRDGTRVILSIINAFKAYRPLLFFFCVSFLCAVVGLGLGGWAGFGTSTGTPRSDLVNIVSLILIIVAFIFMACGIILDTINHRIRELAQLISMRTHGNLNDSALKPRGSAGGEPVLDSHESR